MTIDDIEGIDYRLSWLRSLADSTDTGIIKLKEFSAENPWFDGLFILEYTEYYLGPLAVAIHTYCLGTIKEIKRRYPNSSLTKQNKLYFYQLYEHKNGKPSPVDLLCSISNLFKHQEEWDSWPNNHTTKVLLEYNIDAETEFPIHEGFSKLDLWEDIGMKLQTILSDWKMCLKIEAEQGVVADPTSHGKL